MESLRKPIEKAEEATEKIKKSIEDIEEKVVYHLGLPYNTLIDIGVSGRSEIELGVSIPWGPDPSIDQEFRRAKLRYLEAEDKKAVAALKEKARLKETTVVKKD